MYQSSQLRGDLTCLIYTCMWIIVMSNQYTCITEWICFISKCGMLDHGLRHIITELYRCNICEFIQFISIPVYMYFVARPGNMTLNTILLPDRKSQDKWSCQTDFLIQFVCINRSLFTKRYTYKVENFLFEETYDLTASTCIYNKIFFYNLTRYFIISPC